MRWDSITRQPQQHFFVHLANEGLGYVVPCRIVKLGQACICWQVGEAVRWTLCGVRAVTLSYRLRIC